MDPDKSVHDLLIKIKLEDDQASFRQLYFHYYRRIFSVVKFYLRDHANSEEVVNEVFVSIWKKRSQFQEIRSFTSYIYGCAKNHSLNYLAKNRLPVFTDVEDINTDILDSNANAVEHLAGKDLSKQVNQIICQLPHKGRLIFMLIKNDGLSYSEVAELLNISVKTVEYHMGVCLKRIAQSLNHVPRFMNKRKR